MDITLFKYFYFWRWLASPGYHIIARSNRGDFLLAHVSFMISVVSTRPSDHATRTQNKHLLERNETRGVGGTNTGPTVLDGLAVAIVRNRFINT